MKENLINTLRQYEHESGLLSIEGWLLNITESRNVSIGLRSREIGGVYSPPQSNHVLTGNLYIRWTDGLISQMNLTRPLVRDSENLIRFMRDAAFEDPFAPEIPEPQIQTSVEVYSPFVEELSEQKPSDLISYLNQANELFKALETKNCMAVVECSIHTKMLNSSRGLSSEFRTTKMEFGASADSLYDIGIASRDIITNQKASEHLKHLEEMIHILKNKVKVTEDISTIILMPDVAQRFVAKYLLENLNAESVYDKRSAFRVEDIAGQTQRFHETFCLYHHPCRSMHIGSYPMDSQGIASKSVTFIENGKIINADVTLKGARQTGWQPTPLANPDSLVIAGSNENDLFDFIGSIKNAYLVTNILGLHTQDAGRGDYSVAVPHGIIIKEGKMIGSAKSIISGNFFDILKQSIITLSSPYHSFKGIAFGGKIQF